MSNKLRYFSELIASFMIEVEYKKVIKKLKKYDLIADVDDQRFHHFSSYKWVWIIFIRWKYYF